jgi:hypothetical protein
MNCFHCGQPCSGDTTEVVKKECKEKGEFWHVMPICDNPDICPDNIFTQTANILHDAICETVENNEDKSFVAMKIATFILLLTHQKGWDDKETANQLHHHFYGN